MHVYSKIIEFGADAANKDQSLTIDLDGSIKNDLPSKQSETYAEFYFPIVPTTFGENDLTMEITFAKGTYTKEIHLAALCCTHYNFFIKKGAVREYSPFYILEKSFLEKVKA